MRARSLGAVPGRREPRARAPVPNPGSGPRFRTPVRLLGRAVRVHPLAVVLTVAAGGLVAGIGGAVVA
ncbi:hypothetical protein AB0R11_22880, partial [Streptomyces fradiae]|uniref:hypothetical protein n=1 Tax=Streptomyces fradiae TaxID=1906 RepID=UPI00342FF0BE